MRGNVALRDLREPDERGRVRPLSRRAPLRALRQALAPPPEGTLRRPTDAASRSRAALTILDRAVAEQGSEGDESAAGRDVDGREQPVADALASECDRRGEAAVPGQRAQPDAG